MAMTFTFAAFAVVLLIDIAFFGLIIYLIVLLIKALRKYLRSAPVRKKKAETAKTLGEALRQERARCKMTPGVRSGIPGRQPPGGVQVGVRRLRPQHVQSAGAGQALWHFRRRIAALCGIITTSPFLIRQERGFFRAFFPLQPIVAG